MGYGLGAGGRRGARDASSGRRPISLMGDGGFWHNGLTSGIGNAVFNSHDGLTIIVDNGYSAATGGQYILSSQGGVRDRKTRNPIEEAVRGVGVEWVRRVQTYDMKATHGALKRGADDLPARPEGRDRRRRMSAQPAAPHRTAAAQASRGTAGVSCARNSASMRTCVPATTRASACPAVRR